MWKLVSGFGMIFWDFCFFVLFFDKFLVFGVLLVCCLEVEYCCDVCVIYL